MPRVLRFTFLAFVVPCSLFAAQKFELSTVLPVEDSVPPLKVSGEWIPATPLDDKIAAAPHIIVFRAWMETSSKRSFMSFNSSLAPTIEGQPSHSHALPGLSRQLSFSRPRFKGVPEAWITLVYNPPSAAKRGSEATPRILSARPVILDKKKEAILREKGWKHNVVWLSVLIDTEGKPKIAEAYAAVGPAVLDMLSAELAQWRFAPGRKDGKPVAVMLPVPMLFVKKSSLPTNASRLQSIDEKQTYWIGLYIGNHSQPETDSPIYALEAPEIALTDEDLESLKKAGRRDLAVHVKINAAGKTKSVTSSQDDASAVLRILKRNLDGWVFSIPREKGNPVTINLTATARVLSLSKDKPEGLKLLVDHAPVYPDDLRELTASTFSPAPRHPSFAPILLSSTFSSPSHFRPRVFSPDQPLPRSFMSQGHFGSSFSSRAYMQSSASGFHGRSSFDAWDPIHRSGYNASSLLARDPRRIRGKLSGDANVAFTVDENGEVTEARVISSTSPLFDAPAIRAILSRIYAPAAGRDPVESKQRLRFFAPLMTGSTQPYMALSHSPVSTQPYDIPPAYTFQSPPIFPYEMLMTRTNGRAVADIHIDASGIVTHVDIAESSHPDFGASLRASLEACTFKPARKDGRPVAAVVRRIEEFTWFGKSPSPLSFSQKTSPQERPALTIAPPGSAFVALAVEEEDLESHASLSELDSEQKPFTSRQPRFPLNLPPEVSAGTATIEYMIDREGIVRLPRVVQASHPSFGYAAIQAVAFWGYMPPTRAGIPVSTTNTVIIRFNR